MSPTFTFLEAAKSKKMRGDYAVLLSYLLYHQMAVLAYVPVSKEMKSFSSAIKGGKIAANEEKILYEHSSGQPGVITEQWFTGMGVMDELMRIRIYVDGEQSASIDFMLLLGHGIGGSEAQEVQYIPWGTRKVAHAADGGIYNTYRIPFGKSVRVTATHPRGGVFWYIIRGVENYPLVLGDLLLPPSARLKLFKNEDVVLKPLEFITLANMSNTAGALFQVMLAGNSTDYNYLEACFRAVIDGTQSFLSSGTEDFFLSAYYFDKGIYHMDNAGLTSKSGKGIMSAYKFFENDPLLFTKSFSLLWRCGETANGKDGCPNDFPPPPPTQDNERRFTPLLAETKVTTYTWMYVWNY